MTKAEIAAEAKLLAGDTDSTDAALALADYYSLIESWYLLYSDRVEPRYIQGVSLCSADTAVYRTLSATDIAEIKSVSMSSVELEYVPFSEWKRKIAASSAAGTPAFYHVRRIQSDAESNIGKWGLWTYPPSTSPVGYNGLVRKVPADLSTGTTEVPDISKSGCYVLARLVASDAARMMGESDDVISDILAPIPDAVKTEMGVFLVQRAERDVKVARP